MLPPKFDVVKHGDIISLLKANANTFTFNNEIISRGEDGEFLEHVLMDYDYFKENWMTQFAIGRVGDKNYMDLAGWAELTQNFIMGVIVLDKDNNPLFVIQRLTKMLTTQEQEFRLREEVGKAAQAKNIPDEEVKSELINNFSKELENILGDEPVPFFHYIPRKVFIENGIVPEVLQQVIYIRDNYKKPNGESFTPDDSELSRVERILYANHDGGHINDVDRKFIQTITKGEFIFNQGVNKVDNPVNESPVEEKPFDPFED